MRGLRSGRVHTSITRSALGLLLVALITPLLGVGTAHAEVYQFWGFYTWNNGAWEMAQKGPAGLVPEDGSVDGWRFAISAEEPRLPRADGDFEQICEGTPAERGKKRVAIVLDYGIAQEAPTGDQPQDARGDCAVVPPDASSAQVLAAVAEVREEQSLTCAIDGYPSKGCGDPVDEAPKVSLPEKQVELRLPTEATMTHENDGSGSSDASDASEQTDRAEPASEGGGLPIWGVTAVALVVIIALGGLLTRRQSQRKG